MPAGHARPARDLRKAAHLEELELLPMCGRGSGLDAGPVDKDQPPAMASSVTAVLTRALHLGTDLFRLRRCLRHRHATS
jgi:hypothetical protein